MRRAAGLGKHRGMTDAPHLLIAWHSRTGGSEALARAAAEGAATARLIAAPDDVRAKNAEIAAKLTPLDPATVK